jgi:hypothetical protein
MNPLVESLAPVVITGFALQQLLVLLDPILEKWLKPNKEWILSLLAFLFGLVLSLLLDLRVLRPFGITSPGWLDTILTALLITGGTKWVNDLTKVINYKTLELRARAEGLNAHARDEVKG